MLQYKVVTRGSSNKKPQDSGKVIYQTDGAEKGEIRYFWLKKAYSVSCNTSNCFCRTTKPVFKTKEDAIKAWNNRS